MTTTFIVIAAEELAQRIVWMQQGTRRLLDVADALEGTDPGTPSALPDWTRAHVLAHTAQNADALINLLTWARTGVATPMYASPDARVAAIEAALEEPMAVLLAQLHASADRLQSAVDDLPEGAWSAVVKTAQGRDVAAAEVPWMRVREVWIHAIDLGAGTGFGDVPTDLAIALLHDIARTIGAKYTGAGVVLRVEGMGIDIPLGPEPTGHTVAGKATELLAWLSGRDRSVRLVTDGELPMLPAWL